jgi:phospho-N-acetylmuramoyl-pentapeptide-transferase
MVIFLKNPLILLIIAIIPVIETISVILQVLYFRKTGKRLFKMSPLHHHFELTGWRENKVVGVFSTITLIASIIGIFAV